MGDRTKNAEAAALAEVANWQKSFGSAWASSEEDGEGVWIVGTIDEEGNKYPVITIEADQYDAPGESEKIARAFIALWSQAFSATVAQSEQLRSALEAQLRVTEQTIKMSDDLLKQKNGLAARVAELSKDRDDCLAAREHYVGLYAEAAARGAELESQLGREHEAHRRTWRQLEQAQLELAAMKGGQANG